MAAQRDKCLLAYSGGLDTSVAIQWLKENKGVDVIALVVDVGQERQDLEFVRQKALDIGATESVCKDVREEYVEEFLAKALTANALYENKYPLLSAMSRPIIVKHLVEEAHRCGARYIAHGCTGKGNDQVRFEVGIAALDPDIEVLAPVREWDLKTREQEMEYAERCGIPVPTTKAAPSNAACSRIRGWSRRRTSTRSRAMPAARAAASRSTSSSASSGASPSRSTGSCVRSTTSSTP
jgi:argininosuccinate synthase